MTKHISKLNGKVIETITYEEQHGIDPDIMIIKFTDGTEMEIQSLHNYNKDENLLEVHIIKTVKNTEVVDFDWMPVS